MKKFVVFLALVASVCFIAMPASATVSLCESLSCGESHTVLAGSWQVKYYDAKTGVGYYYEILDKTADGNGYKVKPMAIILLEEHFYGNVYKCFHLEGCQRGLNSVDACLQHLQFAGFQLEKDGAEPGGGSGKHKTVMRGPIYRIPDSLIK